MYDNLILTGLIGYAGNKFNKMTDLPKDWKIVGYITNHGELYCINNTWVDDYCVTKANINLYTEVEVIKKITIYNRKLKLEKINGSRKDL